MPPSLVRYGRPGRAGSGAASEGPALGSARHTARALAVADTITLMPLPAHAPELNPVETIWQVMRDTWLSNRVFDSSDDIVDHCCAAWSRLVDQPWTIMSIGLRDWAHGH
jgi:transposase